MSGSREDSPDWLRTFQAPTQSVLTLSSGSESSPNDSPSREDRMNEKGQSPEETQFLGKGDEEDCGEESSFNKTLKSKPPNKRPKVEHKFAKKIKADNCSKKGNGGDGKDAEKDKFEKHIEPNAPDNSVWNLSSDSESPYNSPPREASKGKSPKKGLRTEDPVPAKKKRVNSDISKKGEGIDGGMEIAEEEAAEKNIESRFSSSRLPLVLSEKASRTKALVECEGESIELSGDVGVVGRVVISDNPCGNHEMFLDLKGTMYKTTIVPSRTFCVVSFGQSDAKVEAIMNDFIQLKPQSNVYEAETMVEGTLDGFSFDSEDDADNLHKTAANQTDQNEGSAGQSNKKSKTKAEKSSGVARKRGKVAGGKPSKKAKRKTQAPKKGKAKK